MRLRTATLLMPLSIIALLGVFLSSTEEAIAQEPSAKYFKDYQRPDSIPFPNDNAFSKERELLGRTLFFDPRLSGSNWISCASCHNPGFSWGDGLPKGIGADMKVLGRRTPTILNLAWGELMFWDGRVSSLEEQALEPLSASAEMNLPHHLLIPKLESIPGYRELFRAAYPGEGMSLPTVAKAISVFERTIVSGEAPFDRYVRGDRRAISSEAKKGFVLFNEKALCSKCHSGWRFSDEGFYDIGIDDEDLGRGKILSDIESVQHAFKTPTLRNVVERAPYFHDGSAKTLSELVAFYNQGGKARRTTVSEHVKPLNLSVDEQAAIVAFLKTLSSQDKPVSYPVLPH